MLDIVTTIIHHSVTTIIPDGVTTIILECVTTIILDVFKKTTIIQNTDHK